MSDDASKSRKRRKRNRRSLRVPVDEVPRPTQTSSGSSAEAQEAAAAEATAAAATAAEAVAAEAAGPRTLEDIVDGSATAEMPVFDARVTLETVDRPAASADEPEELASEEILLTEESDLPSAEIVVESEDASETSTAELDLGATLTDVADPSEEETVEAESPDADPDTDADTDAPDPEGAAAAPSPASDAESAANEASADEASAEEPSAEEASADKADVDEASAAEADVDQASSDMDAPGAADTPDAEPAEDAEEPRPEASSPAVAIQPSVVIVSRVVSVHSAPGAVAPPPPEPDTLVGAEVDVPIDDELDDDDDDPEVLIETAEAEFEFDAEEDEEEAEELSEDLLEEADDDEEAAAASLASRPPPPPAKPPAKAGAPPPPPEEGKASKPPAKKKQKKTRRAWWEGLFNDDYLRTVPIPHPKHIVRQCDFIEQRLGLAPGATILDVGCGLGLHAVELTRRGYLVVGLDLSLPMLTRAADEAQEHGMKINFLHADMQEMNFDGAFDAVLCWGTTFGYFDDDSNRQVVERLYRALKPRGLLLLDTVNRDYVIASQPNLVWFEGDGCVVMEETQLNYITSRLEVKRTVILDDGRQRDTRYSVRLYTLHELGHVLHHRGFRVVEVSGREAHPGVYFGSDSPRLIILAERRPAQAPPPPGSKSEPAEPEPEPEEVVGEEPEPPKPSGPPPAPSVDVNEALAEAIEQSSEAAEAITPDPDHPEGEG